MGKQRRRAKQNMPHYIYIYANERSGIECRHHRRCEPSSFPNRPVKRRQIRPARGRGRAFGCSQEQLGPQSRARRRSRNRRAGPRLTASVRRPGSATQLNGAESVASQPQSGTRIYRAPNDTAGGYLPAPGRPSDRWQVSLVEQRTAAVVRQNATLDRLFDGGKSASVSGLHSNQTHPCPFGPQPH
jgi:hypothetical protein